MMIEYASATAAPRSTHEMQRVYLREWRMHKDLSQTDLAKRIGVTKGEISRLEGGTRRMTMDWLDRIATAMMVDARDLMRKPTGESAVLSVGKEPPPRGGRPPIPRAPAKLVSPENKSPKRSVRGLAPVDPNLLLHEVVDSEMSPVLSPGDEAIVDTTKTSLTPSGLFLITEFGVDVVRRIQVSPATGLVKVSAEHPSFESYEYRGQELTKLHIVGRVVGRVTGV